MSPNAVWSKRTMKKQLKLKVLTIKLSLQMDRYNFFTKMVGTMVQKPHAVKFGIGKLHQHRTPTFLQKTLITYQLTVLLTILSRNYLT